MFEEVIKAARATGVGGVDAVGKVAVALRAGVVDFEEKLIAGAWLWARIGCALGAVFPVHTFHAQGIDTWVAVPVLDTPFRALGIAVYARSESFF